VAPDLILRDPGRGWRKLTAAGWDGTSELVVLNPAGAFPGRNWPLERYREFAERWASHRGSVRFLLLGQSKIAPKAQWLAASLGTRAISLVGHDTPGEAFAMLRHARLVVSEDSGLMHMSWAAGTPTIALFGASRWVWAQPQGNYCEAVVTCRAGDGICMAGTCRAGPESCLATLQAAPVVDLGLALLERIRHQPRSIYLPPARES
jgi:ADP-heptose:LPS heptosyltransferase